MVNIARGWSHNKFSSLAHLVFFGVLHFALRECIVVHVFPKKKTVTWYSKYFALRVTQVITQSISPSLILSQFYTSRTPLTAIPQ